MNDSQEHIDALEAEYDRDTGFLGRLRRGEFDPKGLERLDALVRSIYLGDGPLIQRRLVALLWMIPSIMSWQIERVAERGGDVEALRQGVDRVESAVQGVLGIP
jgi:hypothetical protein